MFSISNINYRKKGQNHTKQREKCQNFEKIGYVSIDFNQIHVLLMQLLNILVEIEVSLLALSAMQIELFDLIQLLVASVLPLSALVF